METRGNESMPYAPMPLNLMPYAAPMKFSAWPSVTNPWSDPVEEVQHVEATGWHGIWIGDHFMAYGDNTSGPWQEAWSVLAGLAALTSRVKLGTLVTGNTYRYPPI